MPRVLPSRPVFHRVRVFVRSRFVRLPFAAGEVVTTAVWSAPPSNPAVDRMVAHLERSIRVFTEDAPAPADTPDPTDADPEFDRVRATAPRLEALGYKLVRPLGKGTYGAVFLAVQKFTGREVAVKFFVHGTADELRSLRDEVDQLKRLDGVDGLVVLHDANPDNIPPFFIMEYASGGSLAAHLRESGGRMPPAEAVAVVRRVADTLAAMHMKGVIHCDLKPANLLLRDGGRPLVADFGQAKLSGDLNPALGTFFYMPPEQADAGRPRPDTRWDVYALGAILYELLTGTVPRYDVALSGELCDRSTALPTRLKKYQAAVRRAARPTAHRRLRGVDRSLARLVDRCLESEPDARFRDAGAVAAAFHERDRRAKERPLLAAAVALTLLVPLVVAGIGGWAIYKADEQGTSAATDLARKQADVNVQYARTAADALRQGLTARIEWLTVRAADDDLKWQVATAVRDARAVAKSGSAKYPFDWKQTEPHRKRLASLYPAGRSLFPNGMSMVAAVDGRAIMLAQVGTAAGGGLIHWGENPVDLPVMQKNWAFRDWFHGGGNREERDDVRTPPVSVPHASQPYRSRTNGKVLVDFSVPVYPPGGDGEPVGVLVGGVPADQFSALIAEKFGAADPAAFRQLRVWVGNERGHYVWHAGMADDGLVADQQATLGLTDPNPVPHLSYFHKRTKERLDAPAELAGVVAGGTAYWFQRQSVAPASLDLTADRLSWTDPLSTAPAGDWPTAAAVCKAPGRPDNDEWVVIVQPTDYTPPQKAVDDTRNRLLTAQAVTLGLIAGLAAVGWTWLVRLLRRSGGPA